MIKTTLKLSLTTAVLAIGISSANATETAGPTSIMPQNVQPMATTELDNVRGMWSGMPAKSQAGAHANYANGTKGDCPPGILKRAI